jgi:site-specific DNA-cytosine methylase
VCRNPAEGRGKRKATSTNAETSLGSDSEPGELIAVASGQAKAEILENNMFPTLTCRKDYPYIVDTKAYRKSSRAISADGYETWVEADVSNTLNCFDIGDIRSTHTVVQAYETHPADSRVKEMGETCQTVVARFGTGGGNTPIVSHTSVYSVREDAKANTFSATESDVANCLQAAQPATTSHHAINYVVQSAIPIQDVRDIEKKQNGMGIGDDGDPSYTLDSMGTQGVAQDIGAFKLGQSAQARSLGYSETLAPTLMSTSGGNSVPAVHTNMVVRRLTPVECERLQGFPDGYTDISWYKSKAGCFREELGKYGCPEEQNAVLETATDGARFKALGNSMAVPVIRWLGEQITKANGVIGESKDG